ncbi:Capsid/spike protein, ssDNA virus [Cinara cedri]|uniref:Capsid/spike protein, ssDNA virus n=1 Tax=Cinara cedri TaxID=506608 RepID=A0A5E4MT58_9HEMI|nr:Capsid/spike protein, ssDNA virus [Cinara cedri]
MTATKTADDKVSWSRINEFISKCDASSLIGKTVYVYDYTPAISYLTPPWNARFNGYVNSVNPTTKEFGMANMRSFQKNTIQIVDMSTFTENHKSINSIVHLDKKRFDNIFAEQTRYYSLIEMGQFARIGFTGPYTSGLQHYIMEFSCWRLSCSKND